MVQEYNTHIYDDIKLLKAYKCENWVNMLLQWHAIYDIYHPRLIHSHSYLSIENISKGINKSGI